MSEIVVDASVALCWFAREAESPSANRLIGSRVGLVAPTLLLAEIDHSVYDCCYLALALRRGAPLVTLDRFFVAGAAKGRYRRSVVHLADWSDGG